MSMTIDKSLNECITSYECMFMHSSDSSVNKGRRMREKFMRHIQCKRERDERHFLYGGEEHYMCDNMKLYVFTPRDIPFHEHAIKN